MGLFNMFKGGSKIVDNSSEAYREAAQNYLNSSALNRGMDAKGVITADQVRSKLLGSTAVGAVTVGSVAAAGSLAFSPENTFSNTISGMGAGGAIGLGVSAAINARRGRLGKITTTAQDFAHAANTNAQHPTISMRDALFTDAAGIKNMSKGHFSDYGSDDYKAATSIYNSRVSGDAAANAAERDAKRAAAINKAKEVASNGVSSVSNAAKTGYRYAANKAGAGYGYTKGKVAAGANKVSNFVNAGLQSTHDAYNLMKGQPNSLIKNKLSIDPRIQKGWAVNEASGVGNNYNSLYEKYKDARIKQAEVRKSSDKYKGVNAKNAYKYGGKSSSEAANMIDSVNILNMQKRRSAGKNAGTGGGAKNAPRTSKWNNLTKEIHI